MPKKHQFSENLSFETCISSQEVMLGAPKLGGTLLGSMQRFWALFLWRWTLLKNNPQCPQNANKSRIFGHTGGYMSRRGTARDEKLFFLCPHRSHVFSKQKGDIDIIIFGVKVLITPIKVTEGRI